MPVTAALWYQLVVTKSKCEGLIYKIRTQQRGTKVQRPSVRFAMGPDFSAESCIFCVDEFSVVRECSTFSCC